MYNVPQHRHPISCTAASLLASVVGMSTAAEAQDGHFGGHTLTATAPVAAVWDDYLQACGDLLRDPQSFVQAHPTHGPDGAQLVNRSPDNQVLTLSGLSPGGAWYVMELIGIPGELHILCDVTSEPEIETFADPALYDQLSRQSESELRAEVTARGGSVIVGGRLPLRDVMTGVGFSDALPDAFFTYIFGIQTELAGEPRFIYGGVNGGALSLSGHYVLRAADPQPSADSPQPQVSRQPDTSSGPETAMQAAVEQCLRNYRTPASAIPALQALGLTLTPGMDAGSWEFSGSGLFGNVEAGTEIYCSIQSTEVPLERARAIGADTAAALFPGMVQQGAPEGGTGPCDGLSIFAPRQLIWLRYAQAGNSGECINDGTSAIIIN